MSIPLSRRSFFGASIAGLAAASQLDAQKPADALPKEKEIDDFKKTDDFAFQPSTLFLTWQRDPTTTMTIQWVGTVGETADTNDYLTFDLTPEQEFTITVSGVTKTIKTGAAGQHKIIEIELAKE